MKMAQKRMKKQIFSISCFLTLLFIAVSASATTYYVSNSGSDSNSGTSESSPWQTLSKIQGRTFSPGDSILLKKGDIWHESLRIPSGGTAGNYITLSSYGSGPKPVISSGSADAILVTTSNRGYWRIDGLNISATGRAIYFDYWPNDMGPVPGWIIENCDLDTRIYVSGPNTIIRNNVVNGGLRSDSKYGGITFRGANSNGSLVEGNTISGFYDRGIWIYHGVSHMTVRNNEVYNIKRGSDHLGSAVNWDGYGVPGRDTHTYGNYFHDVDGAGICYENTYYAEDYQNFIENAGAGIFVWWYDSQNGSASYQNSHHNIIYNPDNAFVIHYAGTINITNNVFYKTNSFGTERYGLYFTGNTYVENIIFANNIIAGTNWRHPIYAPFINNVFSVFDNNIIVPAGSEIMYRNYANLNISQVRALGYMANGLTSNPLFVSAPNDFHLQDSSAGINAGYTTSNTLDYENNPLNGVQDIGAYEFQGSAPPATADLVVNAGTGGTATGSANDFDVPATRSISATANSGYTFSSWTKTSGDCVVTNPASASTTATINTGTCILQATFSQIPTGTLTVNAGTGGTASGSASGFNLPATRTISATPSAGYLFSTWTKTSGDCIVTNPSAATTTATINSGTCTVQATFDVQTGTLTVNAGTGGTASGSTSGFVLPSTKTISATPNSGYQFNAWIKSGDCTIANTASSTTTATINSGTCIAQATFSLLATGNLSVTAAAGGSASGSATGFNLPATRTISAAPSAGYFFSSWTKTSGDCAVTNPSSAGTTVAVNSGTCNVQAVFSPIPTGNLSVSATMGGIASGSSSNFYLPANLTVSAAESQGYYLNNWTTTAGDCFVINPSSETATVQVNTGWCYVQAHFNQITQKGNLSVSATTGGTATGTTTDLDLPAVLAISAVPNADYRFVSWILQSGECSAENLASPQTTITINNGWCYAEASFAPLAPPLIEVYTSSVDSTINSDLNCVYQVSGQNNAPVSVKVNWLKNGAVVFENHSAALSKSNLNVNDKWSCQIDAHDEYSSNVQTSEEILIGTTIVDNTQPPSSSPGGRGHDTYIYNTYINYTNQTIAQTVPVNQPLPGNSIEPGNGEEFLPAFEGDAKENEQHENEQQLIMPIEQKKTRTKSLNILLYLAIAVIIIGTVSAISLRPVKSDWRVLQFIETSLKNGFRKESIERVLRQQKYTKRTINYHMKLSRNQILAVMPQSPDSKIYPPEIYAEIVKYVNAQRAHTYTDDEIEEVLANRGYSKKFIQEVMEKK